MCSSTWLMMWTARWLAFRSCTGYQSARRLALLSLPHTHSLSLFRAHPSTLLLSLSFSFARTGFNYAVPG